MSDFLRLISVHVHDMLFSGGINQGGTWGGAVCASYVPFDVHVYESFIWILLCLFIFWSFGFYRNAFLLKRKIAEELNTLKYLLVLRMLDIFLGLTALCTWLMVVNYKIQLHSLINLFQPCHAVLLAQGISLMNNGATGPMVAMMSLSMVAGSAGALAFPDTSGLDQPFEREAFWLQHYFIQIIPLYLLCRHDFLCAKNINLNMVLLSSFILIFTHWTLFEVVDYSFQVNVNYFLCPAPAMIALFDQFPQWMLQPSYRTFYLLGYIVVSVPLSYCYIGVAHVLRILFGSQSGRVTHKGKVN